MKQAGRHACDIVPAPQNRRTTSGGDGDGDGNGDGDGDDND